MIQKCLLIKPSNNLEVPSLDRYLEIKLIKKSIETQNAPGNKR